MLASSRTAEACGGGPVMLAASGGGDACDWSSLPGELVLQIARDVQAGGGGACSLRATCRTWRAALTHLDSPLSPLGQPPYHAAFPRSSSLDYAARGRSNGLTDEQLAQACSLLGPRLQALNISGAFQLSPAGLAAALRRCPSLQHLRCNGSPTTDEALLAALGPTEEHRTEAGGTSSSRDGGADVGTGAAASVGRGALRQLRTLSLSGCQFLRGDFLPRLAACCPQLSALSVAGCGLALGLVRVPGGALDALCALHTLRRLDVSGSNGVDDAALELLARALPELRCLRLACCRELTDGGLLALGLAQVPAGGSQSSATTATASGSRGGMQLKELDISGCSGLGAGCWHALGMMSTLRTLRLDAMPQLLQLGATPESMPAALWRLAHLHHLSLAGSCCHPTKLKLIAATCGSTLHSLDISASRSSSSGSSSGSGSMGPFTPSSISSSGTNGGNGGGSEADSGARPYRRLTPQQQRDLCAAMGQLGRLRRFAAAGSRLPLNACIVLLEAAALTCGEPAAAAAARGDAELAASGAAAAEEEDVECGSSLSGLHSLDLSGCCQDGGCWAQPLLGVRRQLDFDSHPRLREAGSGVSSLSSAQSSSSTLEASPSAISISISSISSLGIDSRRSSGSTCVEEQPPQPPEPGAARFAAALGALEQLKALRLDGCTSLTPAHLATLGQLSMLCHLSLSHCGDAVTDALVAGSISRLPVLQSLRLCGARITDAAVGALVLAAAAPEGNGQRQRQRQLSLESLSLAGCTRLTPRCLAALAAAPGLGSTLRHLDLSGCMAGATDGVAAAIAARLPRLASLWLTGCTRLTPVGLGKLGSLHGLTALGLSRCPNAITDASLATLAGSLRLLTELCLGEARHLSAAGLAAALPLLPCLARLDLTCCGGLADDELRAVLPELTAAVVAMPQGARSPTGSPLRRRRLAAAA